MASGKLLRLLVQSGTSGDPGAFRSATEQLIKEERQKQHNLLANDLERILYGDRVATNSTRHNILPEPPTDKESGVPLVDIRQANRSIEDLVLNKRTLEIIEDVLEEHRREDVLRSYGMVPAEKILFFGPPGCGKTLTAESMAYELERPLAIVRLDSLVSSFLGETAANLRKVFDFIAKHKLLVLFDEFDALGKERDDGSEHGELRRVVNAVLQMMDSYDGKSTIIAATNHEQILDSAIWRRFDEIVEFPEIDQNQLQDLLQLKLRGVRREFDLDSSELHAIFRDKSPAIIERIIRRAVKRMILKGKEFLTIRMLRNALEQESQI
ncbi:AAA family ATPase [Vibrio parahaemolyticus]|uniref:ATP-binding protein n=2 Tax=Vibrio TaxID=662 RepID=A0AA47JMW6_VIBPH|nr:MULTISPECIES: ATP-binding protein [Vibrio]AYO05888.1 AAA family ATPase [Vibrio parahaemolyticus]EJG0622689.1 AAA family ATPase [Vibrio parahaemolyticus]EJG0640833.1 AAA family ATPase [Vibrio parahaemolyticus]EJG0687703.1 AAA family ATPase [Vibrio parahaemolyticus]EJG0702208.1 AAA family ATPase [Vibrio parahaemolyticus]